MAIWRAPVREQLFQEFKRKEVSADTNAPVPPLSVLSRLFAHTRPTASREKMSEAEQAVHKVRSEWEKKTLRILDRTDKEAMDYNTFNPKSREEFLAEQKLTALLAQPVQSWKRCMMHGHQALCRRTK